MAAYGRLYNWYAVDDGRGLCPSAWHVPSNGEFMALLNYLGGQSVAASSMKTTYGWADGGNGTNEEFRLWIQSFLSRWMD